MTFCLWVIGYCTQLPEMLQQPLHHLHTHATYARHHQRIALQEAKEKENQHKIKQTRKSCEDEQRGRMWWQRSMWIYYRGCSSLSHSVLFIYFWFFQWNETPRLTSDQEEKWPYTFGIISRYIIKTLTSIGLWNGYWFFKFFPACFRK